MDSDQRVILWNTGAEQLLGRSAADALGRHCHEIIDGHDVFGNRFCHADCAPLAMLRRGEPVRCFQMRLSPSATTERALSVTTIKVLRSRCAPFAVVHILRPVQETGGAASFLTRGATPSEPCLTKREREILNLFATGLQNKEIAATLDISRATVRNHVHNILDKLGLHSKLEALALAFRSGWIDAAAEAQQPMPKLPGGLSLK